MAWPALFWLPESDSQPSTYLWCFLVRKQWDRYWSKIVCNLSPIPGPWKWQNKAKLKLDFRQSGTTSVQSRFIAWTSTSSNTYHVMPWNSIAVKILTLTLANSKLCFLFLFTSIEVYTAVEFIYRSSTRYYQNQG